LHVFRSRGAVTLENLGLLIIYYNYITICTFKLLSKLTKLMFNLDFNNYNKFMIINRKYMMNERYRSKDLEHFHADVDTSSCQYKNI
jgi:hypothetical protein